MQTPSKHTSRSLSVITRNSYKYIYRRRRSPRIYIRSYFEYVWPIRASKILKQQQYSKSSTAHTSCDEEKRRVLKRFRYTSVCICAFEFK